MSIRARFILISLSITIIALMLFTSVMHGRVIKYKHVQENHLSHLYLQHLYKKMGTLKDVKKIKTVFEKEEVKELQDVQIYLVYDKNHKQKFIFKNKDIVLPDLKLIKADIRNKKFKGPLKINDRPFYWATTGFEKNDANNKILAIYSLSSTAYSEFFKFFGFPLMISSILLCWLMVWASIILSSLFAKLQKQKQILSDQAIDIEKSRDQALQASSAKTDFLANMSHEIRTPLTSIIGFAESCLDIEQTLKERSKATKIIIKSGKHLLHVINEILDLSKIETGKLEIEKIPVSVIEILDEINQLVSKMAEEKGLTFRINYTYPLPEKIISDPLRLKQILINLCSNAIKFTENGYVYLNVSYLPESSNLTFEVVDTGIGMTEEQIEKIFKPFEQADTSTTRKFGGTGLGLTLSKQLVNMINGEIKVESSVNKGSKFIVSLEIVEVDTFKYIYDGNNKGALEKQNNKNNEIPQLEGKILLAEDNKDIQDLIKLLMKKIGINLDIVENGRQAIKAATESVYDIVFMDVQMPVLDGISAMKELHGRNYNQPVVAMTANAMQKDRDDCKEAGFSGFISKPINRNDLYLLLTQYLKPANKNESVNVMLTSSLLEDDPELIDLIDKFIKRLPAMRDAINKAQTDNNEEELSSLVHQLKGVGGNYGYPMLTELSAKIEFQITSKHTENVTKLIEEFNQMVDQIIQGHDENHKIASQE